MEKKKYVLWAALFLLAASVTGACLYCRPAWKAAKALQEQMDAPGFSYELTAGLDQGTLSAKQRKVFGTLSKLTGISEESLYRLTINGRAQLDRIRMTIYPAGAEEPLTEFFFENDTGVINEAMLYNAVRSHLAEQYTVLGYLMPRQDGNLYMTLEQVEQVLGVDLSPARSFRLAMEDNRLTAGQYFVMLMAMKRERLEDGYRFTLETESANLCFDVPEGKSDAPMALRFRVQNPAEALSRGEWLLSRIGIQMPEADLGILEDISVDLISHEEEPLVMPTDFVNQDIINIISKIRAWLSEAFAREDTADML